MRYDGLDDATAAKILAQRGENVLKGQKNRSAAALFFSQFKGILNVILVAATLLSALLGETTEAISIIAIMLLSAVMGFIQEYRTEKTLAALAALAAPTAHVIRSCREKTIPALEVVVGDILLITAGSRVPADARLLESEALSCDESLLTGESAAVKKKAGELIYMGTAALTGHAVARVTATGMDSEMGAIAGMLGSIEEESTPLQKRLASLAKYIAVICLAVCFAVALLGVLRGEELMDMMLTAVSLSVAAIPEGLPAVITIVLAMSVGRILKKGSVIRRMYAVETLGTAGVICADKTGTITQNRMTVGEIFTFGNEARTRFLEDAALCNNCRVEGGQKTTRLMGTPTESALMKAALDAGVDINVLTAHNRRIAEQPFDSNRKRMSVTIAGKRKRVIVKGAHDRLLPMCTAVATGSSQRPITAEDIQKIDEACNAMAQRALRLICVADKEYAADSGEGELTFVGIAGISDPPRPEVAGAVRTCRRAGIKPVMITGDHQDTAVAVAREAGIYRNGDGVLTGAQLDNMSDTELAARALSVSVYARVSPAHKLKVISAYKKRGMVVAMTGDGVNDAPAVKEADIGIAMGISGTDVTKEASDVVILDDNFATIVSAVEEGRLIYRNIKLFIRYMLASNLGEVITVFVGMLFGLPVIFLPIQILLINLITDGLPAIALGREKAGGDLMNARPRARGEGMFTGGLFKTVLFHGALLGLCNAASFAAVLSISGELATARSAAFMTLIFSQMLYVFLCKKQGGGGKIFDNLALIAAAAVSVSVALLAVYFPILQPIFGTAAVTGGALLPMFFFTFLGPVIGALFLFRQKRA